MRVREAFGKYNGVCHEARLLPTSESAKDRRGLRKVCYVYAIQVDGVVRYIGKGTQDRMFSHMKEVRRRLTRKFKLKNVSPLFQRKLTEATVRGALIEEIVLADDLTSKQAYELEYRYLEKIVHDGKRRQLWNVIPPSIYTPQEYNAYVEKLIKNSLSRNRLGRLLARMQLVRLGLAPAREKSPGASHGHYSKPVYKTPTDSTHGHYSKPVYKTQTVSTRSVGALFPVGLAD